MIKTKTVLGAKIYTNEVGALGHPYHGQGCVEMGDGTSWNGHYNYFSPKKDGVPYRKTFEVSFGGYARYPIPDPKCNAYGWYYKNPWNGNISRDQIMGIILGLIADKDYYGTFRFICHTALSGFILAYNNKENGVDPVHGPWRRPDFLGPSTWASIIRMIPVVRYLAFPLLCVLDIQILIDTFLENKATNDEVINYLGRVSLANDIVRTPTAWLAAKLLNKETFLEKLYTYWVPWRSQPGMYEIHKAAVERL